MTRRGQTIHDYLLGVVLVLLTIAVTIGIVGSAFEPFFDPVDNEDQIMADNLADELIELNQTHFGERTIVYENPDTDEQGFRNTLQTGDLDRLTERAGLPPHKSANVSIQYGGETRFLAGDDPGDEATVQSYRIVRGVTPDGDCGDGCRLVVRVW